MHQKMHQAVVLRKWTIRRGKVNDCRVAYPAWDISKVFSPDGDVQLMTQRYSIKWQQPDGSVISCEEKLKILDENLAEIRQMCQDAFEDALLMGCDEQQVRGVFSAVIDSLHSSQMRRR